MTKERRQYEKRLTVRIDAELDEKIAQNAKDLGMSKNAYIRMVLNTHYQNAG